MKSSQIDVQYRRERMLNYLRKVHRAEVQELAKRFHVTTMTIRRDLDLFQERGEVKRRYGMAFYTGVVDTDVEYVTPTGNPSPAHKALARAAARMIEEGDTVFFNSSSTVLGILEELTGRRVTVVTNNGRALYVDRSPDIDVILTGGDVYGKKQSLVGDLASATLMRVTAGKCFLGVSGISAASGLTSSISLEAPVNRTMLRRCTGMRVVVAEGSKIGKQFNFVSGQIQDITHLITTRDADPNELERIRACGVEVIFADAEDDL